MRRFTQAIASAGIVLSASLCALPAARAQAPAVPRTIEIDNFRTPTSPAFTLLGVAPTAVARPTTPRAFATDLISATNRGSVIPNSYALEVAPYWMKSHPALEYAAYTNPTTSQSMAQSFSISLATLRADSASDTSPSQIAVGFRVLPASGKASAKFRALEAALTIEQQRRLPVIRNQADALDEIDDATAVIARLTADLAAVPPADNARSTALKAQIAAAEKRRDDAKTKEEAATENLATQADSMRSLATAMGGVGAERMGAFLEFAAAAVATYPGSTFDNGKMSRMGVWGTFSYRVESPHLDFISVLRFMRDAAQTDQNALDVGARVLWSHEQLGISAEWVSRTAYNVSEASADDSEQRSLTFTSSRRAVGIIDYRVRDELYITMSFGQDYKTLGETRHPLVAAFGMQFLYGKKAVVKRPTP
jgi:hypothetical protein